MKYWTLILLIGACATFGCGGDDDEDGNGATNVATNNSTNANNGGGEITGCCFYNCDAMGGASWAGPGIADNAACADYAEGECGAPALESEYVDGCTGCNTSCAPDGYVSIPD
jgi:hypothetical protein